MLCLQPIHPSPYTPVSQPPGLGRTEPQHKTPFNVNKYQVEKDNRGELEFAEAAGESAVLELQARWKAQGALAASKVPEKQWPKHIKPRKVRRNKTFEWGLCFFNTILLSVGVQFNYYALDLQRSAFAWPNLLSLTHT